MNSIAQALGRAIAGYLEKQSDSYVAFEVIPPDLLRGCLQPADVILVEGNRRISAAIKYLTVSTWSHAAFFVGDPEGCDLIEADIRHGVRFAPLSEYGHLNMRVCRAIGLSERDRDRVVAFMRGSIGKAYDLKNVLDLARYLMPQPPVPKRWRRRMLALGSGDPTRAICSTLIAEAFQQVRYPILPERRIDPADPAGREIHHIRHHSLYAPRDFDLSPYFEIIKPTICNGFDYQKLAWYEAGATAMATGSTGPSPPASPRP